MLTVKDSPVHDPQFYQINLFFDYSSSSGDKKEEQNGNYLHFGYEYYKMCKNCESLMWSISQPSVHNMT